jgi:hypothetical protein
LVKVNDPAYQGHGRQRDFALVPRLTAAAEAPRIWTPSFYEQRMAQLSGWDRALIQALRRCRTRGATRTTGLPEARSRRVLFEIAALRTARR